jgi:hypothetical protein
MLSVYIKKYLPSYLLIIMENFNTKLSSESIRNVNALIQKIEGVCKNIEQNLAMCLELNSGAVAQYSVTTANKVESEFVDRIILNIDKIKNHLRDLKKALSQKVISDMDGITTII